MRVFTMPTHLRTVDGDDPAAGSGGGENQSAPVKSFTQEEVDAIVEKRVSCLKSQYSDYDELKAKAGKFDEQEEAGKSELEKARQQAAKYKAELDKANAERDQQQWKAEASAKYGVPAGLLHGSTEAEIEENAKALKEWHDPDPEGFPVHDPEKQPNHPSKVTGAQDFGNAMEKIGF